MLVRAWWQAVDDKGWECELVSERMRFDRCVQGKIEGSRSTVVEFCIVKLANQQSRVKSRSFECRVGGGMGRVLATGPRWKMSSLCTAMPWATCRRRAWMPGS